MVNTISNTRNAGFSTALQPVLDQSSPPVAVGLDVGNGGVKVVASSGQILIESYLYYPSERFTANNLGYCEYVSGDRSDLIGRFWIGGIGAYYANPAAISRTVDDRSGKVDQCLQLLLSALSHFPYRPELSLRIAASIHDGQTFGAQLRAALQGVHRVKIRGKDCTIRIALTHVVEEGSGTAIALQQSHDFSNALLFDLGNGTAICSAFSGVQMVHREYNSNSGVESLIAAITK
jgi:hypothetical protein